MAKKRTRTRQSHSGSVYQSGGVWFAAVMVHGKRRRVRCQSKADANARRHELCQLAAAGSTLQPASFGVFRERWLEHVRANQSSKTALGYQYAIDHFRSLDDIPLERITGQAIQTIVDGLSGKTKQQCYDNGAVCIRTQCRGWTGQSIPAKPSILSRSRKWNPSSKAHSTLTTGPRSISVWPAGCAGVKSGDCNGRI